MRDYRVYGETDNGEFITTAQVDLIEDGEVVLTRLFVASSEDSPDEGFSAYGNGQSNHARTQALSYANAWCEAEDVEQQLAPFGPEWQREQEDRS